MGGRQSTATTAPGGTGSTATVSGPQGGGSGGRGPATGSSAAADVLQFSHGHHHHHHHTATPGASTGGSSSSQSHRQRGGSTSAAAAAHHRGFPIGIPASNGGAAVGGALGSPGSDDSTPDDDPMSRGILGSAIPVHLFSFRDIKCPVCSKLVPPDDVECHFVMCLTRPRINYNEDVLLEDKDECAICFEELLQGETIARLPCLCIYHKRCIDQWFKVKRSCPEHPND